jgi:hypothetical protein
MKLGAEDKKKVGALAALALVGGYLFYSNVLSQPSGAPAEKPRAGILADRVADPGAPAPSGSGAGRTQAQPPSIRRATSGRANRGDEFHPTLRSKRPEDRIDPATIDPTLRLDLLAKVQGVNPDGGERNVFQFGQPPKAEAPLKGPEPKVLPKVQGPKTPEQAKAEEAPPPAKQPPAPINLKYYGYSTARSGGRKTAFFLDGEDILVAPEGDTVKKRYKVVRIGVNSVLMEDTVGGNQQSLPLQEEGSGA